MGLFNFGNSGSSTTTTTRKGAKFNVETPYSSVQTNKKGVSAEYSDGSALDTLNKFVNSNIGNVLNDYINPSLNSTTNQALLNNYMKNLNSMAGQSFENNVINPLSRRNMIRSSQATNMYNNFNNNLSDNISTYIDSLLAQSQNNSANVLNNLMSNYMNGINALNKNQALGLQGSIANGTTKTTTSGGGSASSLGNMGNTLLQLLPYLISL